MKPDKILYSDSLLRKTVTYRQLIEDLNRGETFTLYGKSGDYHFAGCGLYGNRG